MAAVESMADRGDESSFLKRKLAPFDVLKSAGPKLILFFKTACIYFVAWLPEVESPSVFAAILKCLPVVCLCGFVGLQGVSLDPKHHYNRNILLGLLFSLPGDVFIVWEYTHFLYGVFAFTVAHLFYITAFGFTPLKPLLGIFLLACNGVVYCLYLPNLEGPYIAAIAVYAIVIAVMIWRATAGVLGSEGSQCRWTQMCGCFGALTFGLSDFIIGVNRFCFPLPYARALMMTTYWGGQLGLALSTFNIEEEYQLRVKGQKIQHKQD